nr:replication protein A 70 kDa DNA-binding subunit D-like [Ipomoea batatas]
MGMYSLATGLSTFNNRSAIKVRVIRSYVVREKKVSAHLKSQELVLHDPEHNIQAQTSCSADEGNASCIEETGTALMVFTFTFQGF